MSAKNNLFKIFIRLFKIFAAIAPIIWIFSRIDMKEFGIAIGKVAWWTVPVIVINLLIAMFLQGVRWWILLKAFIVTLPFFRTLSIHFKGMFYSIIFPAAQDVFRAVLLSKENDYKIIWGASWVCKLLGFLIFALLALCGLFIIDTTAIPSQVIHTIGIAIVIIIMLLLFSFTKTVTRHIRPAFKKILPVKIMKATEEIREGIYLYKQKKKSIAVVFFVTFFMQCIGIINAALLLKGITGTLYIKECIFFIAAIEIVVLSLPITPNGVGIREALLPLFLITYLHRSNEELGIYVIIGFLGIIVRIVGGIPILVDLIKGQDTLREKA